jgi:hypothetical protein
MIRLWLEHDERTISFVSLLWKISEAVFKYVGWCMLLGTVQYGYDNTKNWRLRVLSVIMSIVLFLLPYLSMRSVATGIRVDCGRLPRPVSRLFIWGLIGPVVFVTFYVGLGIVESTISVLEALRR